jgi:hypothetical protein
MTVSLNEIAPSFQQAVGKWPEASNLKQHYEDLLNTYETNGSSLIELTKSFFESVCLTIIEEVGAEKPTSASPSTTEIFSSVKKALDIDYIRETNGFGEIISGFNKITNGLETLRNRAGSVSHGRDGFIQHISKNHLRTHLLAADALISLLLNVFEGSEPNLLTTRELYERFDHHNILIDQNIWLESNVNPETQLLEVKVNAKKIFPDAIQINIKPSQLLFELNRPAYQDIILALRSMNISVIEKVLDVEDDAAEAKDDLGESEIEIVPTIPVAETYIGVLVEFYESFFEKIKALEGSLQSVAINSIIAIIFTAIEPLMVTDWKTREEIKSQIRLVLKKIIRENSINISAESVFDWIVENLPADIKGTET